MTLTHKQSTKISFLEQAIAPGLSFSLVQVDLPDQREGFPYLAKQNYYLSQYLITQDVWEEIMGNRPAEFKDPSLPIETISWNEIQEFLRKLNKRLGLRGIAVYRLPDRDEWEYAASGGKYGEVSPYAGSYDYKKVGHEGWFSEGGRRNSQLNGIKIPNELGIYDMSGNLWEWTASLHPESEIEGEPARYMIKGGSWMEGSMSATIINGEYRLAADRDMNIGFRLARTHC